MVQRATPGGIWTPPLARDWNDIGESTEHYIRHFRAGHGPQKKQWIENLDWMWCRNDTGDRAAGEVLEAGDYLLTDVDPFAPWFEGIAPTNPVRESTHGVLRVACKSGKIERVQVAGIVRAEVNVTNTSHNFCDASPGSHVLHSNSVGPHKIVQKPDGTGQLTCWVLLYAAEDGFQLAEAWLAEDMCPSDPGGSGTGSEEQTVQVMNARLIPGCSSFTPTRVVNPYNHRGPYGSKVLMYRRFCGEVEEWVICDVEKRKFCAVAGIESRESCLVGWALQIGAEWCPQDEPDIVCIIEEYEDCEEPLPPCDDSLIFDPLYACCWLDGGTSWGS